MHLGNLPILTFVIGNNDIRCLNYVFQIKEIRLRSASYICSTRNFYASICVDTEMIENKYAIEFPGMVEIQCDLLWRELFEIISREKADAFANAKASAQRNEDRERNIQFKTTRSLFKTKELSFRVYYQSILNMHEFFPKKKYVEELEDTDSSDATSISDDSEN
jgi:hypothetical protein